MAPDLQVDISSDPIKKPFPHNILRPESSRIDVIGQNGNDGDHYGRSSES